MRTRHKRYGYIAEDVASHHAGKITVFSRKRLLQRSLKQDQAVVAKLADALASGASERKLMRVQVPPTAPRKNGPMYVGPFLRGAVTWTIPFSGMVHVTWYVFNVTQY